MLSDAYGPLTPLQLERFVHDGFVRLDDAFPRALGDTCREALWRATGAREDDPSTWNEPVVRLGEMTTAPFREAASTPRLAAAFDALVGPGRWIPRGGLGTFPIRFPSATDPGDTGFHVDTSFGTEDPDFFAWRVNVRSKGRALLMLFLFSDVEHDDAPTRILTGSHVDVARRLAPHGDAGLTLRELADDGFAASLARPEALATGPVGTVYLCHPFLVHAAQPLAPGRKPRFIAQPALLPRGELDPFRGDPSPVERAIREALEER